MGLGVLGSGGRQARPRWAKARRASRTVWVAQLSAAAICEGRQPWSLCSRTWQRRTVKALGERRPQRREVRSVSAKGRTKRGDFIPHDTHRRQLHRLPFAFPLVPPCITTTAWPPPWMASGAVKSTPPSAPPEKDGTRRTKRRRTAGINPAPTLP